MESSQLMAEYMGLSSAEKFAWLRLHAPEGGALPDFYKIPGVDPNGMGPDSWHGDVLAAVEFLLNHPMMNVDLTAVGDWHDWRYFVGGSEADRGAADLGLYNLMQAAVTLKWWAPWTWVEYVAMRKLALIYYRAVRLCGAEYFTYRQSSL